MAGGRRGSTGEPVEFRDFVADRSESLLRAARLLTGDWAMAEDLVQAALLAAWPRWSTLTRPDAPQLYVQRVMLTTYLRWRRRRWNSEVAVGDLPERGEDDNAFEAADVRGSLEPTLATLPPRQRAVVVLRYFLDLSETQTAQVLGCSVGTVKRHCARALARLRQTPGVTEVLTGGQAS